MISFYTYEVVKKLSAKNQRIPVYRNSYYTDLLIKV